MTRPYELSPLKNAMKRLGLLTIYVILLFLNSYFPSILLSLQNTHFDFFPKRYAPLTVTEKQYWNFSESERNTMKRTVKEMFHFAYDNYMQHAFPADELNPIHCSGRGPDTVKTDNININDVLGDYALGLVESLTTLAVMGNSTEFQKAVENVLKTVSFDKPNNIQVFEATIRVMGSLLSAHLIIKDPQQPFGAMSPSNYNDELLNLAHDLANRLLVAFDRTATGIPFPRVDLKQGVRPDCSNHTCTAGAGSLHLEFGILSRLLDDPVYDSVAKRAILRLWELRSRNTDLLGNILDIQTGDWVDKMSGIGAGLDSFFEYILKSYIIFGDQDHWHMFEDAFDAINRHLRKGRNFCLNGTGHPPFYVNVDMDSGETINTWVDSLQAAWPAVLVLLGHVDEAVCLHAMHYALWKRFGMIPERFNWGLKAPDLKFFPLRPELIESTYFLYQATKSPFYLHVGKHIVESINKFAKAKCGYATIHDVQKMDQEDRMESFFLSETCKYLYLLFDVDNHLNVEHSKYIFTTEGHPLPISRRFHRPAWDFGRTSRQREWTGSCPRALFKRPLPVDSFLNQYFDFVS